MRKGVVSDFVAFGVLALQQVWRAIGLVANDKKRSRNALFLQDIQNLWSPLAIRTIVEREHDLLLRTAKLINVIGERVGVVIFAGDEVRGRVISEAALAALGCVHDMPDVAV